MPYDDAFFEAYREYLKEPVVRAAHDRAFHLFREFMRGGTWGIGGLAPRVIDLGCGTGEFLHHGPWTAYVGIDKTPRIERKDYENRARVVEADYKAIDSWIGQITDPEAFVSLFSIEPVFNVDTRYAFYDMLFSRIPSIQWGLSSGFYYSDRFDAVVVEEAGGIQSYQTIEPLSRRMVIEGVNEERLIMRVPSKMFGPCVVEVWKFFARVKS